MNNYAEQIHNILNSYKSIEVALDNPQVKRLRAFGFNALNLSGIIIEKSTNPTGYKNNALITITEINDVDEDTKSIKKTDYVKFGDGDYSEVDQNSTIISVDQLSNITLLKAAVDAISDIQNEYTRLEKFNASDIDLINCEARLSSAINETSKILDSENHFKQSMGEYGPQEHQELMKKLGSLVLDIEVF